MPAIHRHGKLEELEPKSRIRLKVLKHVKPSTDLKDKYAVVVVTKRYPLFTRPHPSMKLIVNDETEDEWALLAVGQVAGDLDRVQPGDTLMLLKFSVDITPSDWSKRYHLLVDDVNGEALVWVFLKEEGGQAVREPLRDDKTGERETQQNEQVHQSPRKLITQPRAESSSVSATYSRLSHEPKNDTNQALQETTARLSPGRVQITSPKNVQDTSKPRVYTYKRLDELKVNTTDNVFGVVQFVKSAQKTRGSDFMCLVTLIDSESSLKCNFFNRERKNLPSPKIGDVMRLHRVKIQGYRGQMQGTNGPGFQWLLFSGSPDQVQASSASYTLEQADLDRAASLFTWWSEKQKQEEEGEHQATAEPGEKRISNGQETSNQKLCEAMPKECFDLLCQVIRVSVMEPYLTVLHVWDGTSYKHPLKDISEAELNRASLTRRRRDLLDLVEDLAVTVYVFDDHAPEAGQIKAGAYIKLTNLHAAIVSGLTELTLHGGKKFNRGFTVLSENSVEMQQFQSSLCSILEQRKPGAENSLDTEQESNGESSNGKRRHRSPTTPSGSKKIRLETQKEGSGWTNVLCTTQSSCKEANSSDDLLCLSLDKDAPAEKMHSDQGDVVWKKTETSIGTGTSQHLFLDDGQEYLVSSSDSYTTVEEHAIPASEKQVALAGEEEEPSFSMIPETEEQEQAGAATSSASYERVEVIPETSTSEQQVEPQTISSATVYQVELIPNAEEQANASEVITVHGESSDSSNPQSQLILSPSDSNTAEEKNKRT